MREDVLFDGGKLKLCRIVRHGGWVWFGYYAVCLLRIKKMTLEKKNLRVYLVQVYPPCLELQKKCFLFSFTAATAGNAFCFAW